MNIITRYGWALLLAAVLVGSVWLSGCGENSCAFGCDDCSIMRVMASRDVYARIGDLTSAIGKVKKGECVELLSQGDSWVRVRMKVNGKDTEGYVKRIPEEHVKRVYR
ncbi:hypothetical protein R80B4_02541 [Fibrobacteres bacterium R8-0-B4]